MHLPLEKDNEFCSRYFLAHANLINSLNVYSCLIPSSNSQIKLLESPQD